MQVHLRIPTNLINELRDLLPPDKTLVQKLKDLLIPEIKKYIEGRKHK